MKLRGGVIIVGSLSWEDHLRSNKQDFVRKKWTSQNLLDKPNITPAPIRYGRKSSTRKNNYTMIYSKSCETTPGQGLIFEFNNVINSFDDLETQAIALAIAEGIYTPVNKRITSTWGSVGMLLNPSLEERDFATYEFIRK